MFCWIASEPIWSVFEFRQQNNALLLAWRSSHAPTFQQVRGPQIGCDLFGRFPDPFDLDFRRLSEPDSRWIVVGRDAVERGVDSGNGTRVARGPAANSATAMQP
jgi:hypothetical protein